MTFDRFISYLVIILGLFIVSCEYQLIKPRLQIQNTSSVKNISLTLPHKALVVSLDDAVQPFSSGFGQPISFTCLEKYRVGIINFQFENGKGHSQIFSTKTWNLMPSEFLSFVGGLIRDTETDYQKYRSMKDVNEKCSTK